MRGGPGLTRLTTVLFLDIVGSTVLAAELGDERWRATLGRFRRLVRADLKRHQGHEEDTAGDGFFATFAQPAAAVRCAVAIVNDVQTIGIDVRCGLHTGEMGTVEGRPGGVAVHAAARVMALAGAAEICCTSTVRDLVMGQDIDFASRGTTNLKGVPGTWETLIVTATPDAPPPPLTPEDAHERLQRIQPERQRRTRLVLATIAVVVVSMVVGTALVLVHRAGDSLERIPVDHIGRLDPADGHLTGSLDVGDQPTDVAIGDHVLWILRLDVGEAVRVDPSSGAATSVPTEGKPSDIAIAADGTVWVLNSFPSASLVSIDPDRVRLEGAPIALETGARSLVFGEGALWVTNSIQGTVSRIDTTTRDVKVVYRSRDTTSDLRGMAVGGGALWVANGSSVLKLDPKDGHLLGSASLLYQAYEVAYGGGAVWVSHLDDDAVSRIDAEQLGAVSISVGDSPIDIAAGDSAVWVTNALGGSVSRIDPRTNASTSVDVGSSPDGIAAGEDAIWVAVHAR
jgi:class 3 adenylate cyclase/streptogramin lyase